MARKSRRGTLLVTEGGTYVRSLYEKQVLEDLERRGVAYAYEAEELEWLETLPKAACLKCGSLGATRKRTYLPDLSPACGSASGTQNASSGDGQRATRPRKSLLTLCSVVELKGRLTADDRKTLKGAKAAHPGREIRILFQRDNWMTRKKARRYSDWARQNGFEHAIGERIPESWLELRSSEPPTESGSGDTGQRRRKRTEQPRGGGESVIQARAETNALPGSARPAAATPTSASRHSGEASRGG